MGETKTNAKRSFRERRMALGRGIQELSRESGVNKGRLSIIERGVVPTLGEHQAIETALSAWEAQP